MNIEIDKIISLFKKNNFLDAEKLCKKLENNFLNDANFYILYGAVLFQLDKINESIEKFDKSILINPNNSDAFYNRGNAFSKIQDFERAILSFDNSISLNKNNPEAYNNKGSALLELNNFDEALNNFNKALGINPNNHSARKNKAYLFEKKGDYEKSIYELSEVLKFDKKNFEVILRLANNYFFLGKYDEALKKYEFAYEINSHYPGVLDGLLMVKLYMCNWNDFEKQKNVLENAIRDKSLNVPPYTASILFNSPEIIYKSTKEWVEEKYNKISKTNIESFKNIYSTKRKIKIGYFSADFHDHATSHLITKTLELHDRKLFQTFGFYFGPNSDSELHKRVSKSFDRFFYIQDYHYNNIVKLSNKHKIDIAVDLQGHTRLSRFEIFLKKCAPIQVNFLTYPGTSGSSKIDYIIADKYLIPKDMKKFYSEKIVYLPNSYQPNEEDKIVSNKIFDKKELGLPEDKFIFCCFNTHQKINPSTFNVWCRILNENKSSVLWLLEDNKFSTKNIYKEASQRGIDVKRIIFAPKLKINEHLVRLKKADLFLDTFPYTAHTTCSDALRVGLPILTREGYTFPSRVAASLLQTSGLKELITSTEEDYINKALLISKDTKYLKNLKKKVMTNKIKMSLFDNKLFTKNLEKAYQKMFKRKVDNLEPDHIYL